MGPDELERKIVLTPRDLTEIKENWFLIGAGVMTALGMLGLWIWSEHLIRTSPY